MADEIPTNAGTGSNPNTSGSIPAQTPASALADAGVSVPDGSSTPKEQSRPRVALAPAVEEVPDVGLVRPASAGPLPQTTPGSPTANHATVSAIETTPRPQPFPVDSRDGAMQDDIQKILGAIRLPERRGPTAPAQAAEKQIPVAPIDQHLEKDAGAAVLTNDKPIAPAVHTLRDDIQHVVRDTKMSLVRAASLEEDRKLREQEPPPTPGAAQRTSRARTILAISALLVVLGVGALLGVFVVMNQYSASPQDTGPVSIIFAEQNLLLPLDNSSSGALKQQVAQLRSAQVGSLGSITRIIPTITAITQDGTQTTRPATTQEFLHAVGATIPDELSRSLGSDFFFGMHSADKNAPVLVIPVLSYDNAFAGMLSWESAMNADLAPIFTPLAPYQTDANGIPHARLFEDAVIRNYDTRTLSDDNATIELYYSFPSPNLLVIAESPYTFAEVISRLRAQRRL